MFPKNESCLARPCTRTELPKLCASLVFRIILDFPAEVAKNLQVFFPFGYYVVYHTAVSFRLVQNRLLTPPSRTASHRIASHRFACLRFPSHPITNCICRLVEQNMCCCICGVSYRSVTELVIGGELFLSVPFLGELGGLLVVSAPVSCDS